MDESVVEKIIDWAMIMDVCGYESLVKVIIKSSLKEARQTVRLLAKAIKAGNSEDVALYAHRLKGVAMMMGATRLSERAYQLECVDEERDMVTAVVLLEQVKDEFEKVRLFLSKDGWIEKAKKQENTKTERQLIWK